MDNRVIVLSPGEFTEFLKPIIQRLERIEAYLFKKEAKSSPVYSDAEAAKFLKCSTKKLQNYATPGKSVSYARMAAAKFCIRRNTLWSILKNMS